MVVSAAVTVAGQWVNLTADTYRARALGLVMVVLGLCAFSLGLIVHLRRLANATLRLLDTLDFDPRSDQEPTNRLARLNRSAADYRELVDAVSKLTPVVIALVTALAMILGVLIGR